MNHGAMKRAVLAYIDEIIDREDPGVARLIGQANYDLHLGPCHEEGYPGFEPACQRIREFFDAEVPRVLYYEDWSECVTDTLPTYEDEDGNPDDYALAEVYEVEAWKVYLGQLHGYLPYH